MKASKMSNNVQKVYTDYSLHLSIRPALKVFTDFIVNKEQNIILCSDSEMSNAVPK